MKLRIRKDKASRPRCGGMEDVWLRLRRWYSGHLGGLLLRAECAELDRILPDRFGYHLLQLGSLNNCDLSHASRISHRIVLDMDPAIADAHTGVYAGFDALPIVSESVDVVVLPHTLEFHPRPHQILREVERITIAEGHVVILGFNPWSLWGASRLIRGWRGHVPWCGQFLSPTRTKDWLELMGYDILETRRVFHRPPLQHPGVMRRLRVLEVAGRRFWPVLSGVYAVVARKKVVTLTPFKPRWRSRRSPLPGLAEPTTRGMGRG